MEPRTPTIEYRDPADLHPHAATKHLHMLGDQDPRFLALVVSIERGGFDGDKPITIDEHGRILDGRHRWRAARRLGLAQVPCIVRHTDEAATVILNSIVARKHFTKGALAFEVYPLFKQAHDAALRRHLEMLKSGRGTISDSVGNGRKVEDFAEQIGVSRDLFDQAAKVHKIFESDPDYAAEMLPRIYAEPVGGEKESSRPVGLGAVIAGYAGRNATKDQPKRPEASQLELFSESIASTFHRWARIEDVGAVRPALREIVTHLREEELEKLTALVDELRAAIKARKGAQS